MTYTIDDAMRTLEQTPHGGIGKDGPTLEELSRHAARGEVWEGDSTYHTVQEAWRILEQVKEGEKHGE